VLDRYIGVYFEEVRRYGGDHCRKILHSGKGLSILGLGRKTLKTESGSSGSSGSGSGSGRMQGILESDGKR